MDKLSQSDIVDMRAVGAIKNRITPQAQKLIEYMASLEVGEGVKVEKSEWPGAHIGASVYAFFHKQTDKRFKIRHLLSPEGWVVVRTK